MPGEIISKLTDAEKLSQDRERAALEEQEGIIRDAKVKAEQIIREAEEKRVKILADAENGAQRDAETLRSERDNALQSTIIDLQNSAKNKASRAADEIIRIISE